MGRVGRAFLIEIRNEREQLLMQTSFTISTNSKNEENKIFLWEKFSNHFFILFLFLFFSLIPLLLTWNMLWNLEIWLQWFDIYIDWFLKKLKFWIKNFATFICLYKIRLSKIEIKQLVEFYCNLDLIYSSYIYRLKINFVILQIISKFKL